MDRVHMMKFWETDMAEAIEKIPKVELTRPDGKGDTKAKSICEVFSMSGI